MATTLKTKEQYGRVNVFEVTDEKIASMINTFNYAMESGDYEVVEFEDY